jgi:hypothetical protein
MRCIGGRRSTRWGCINVNVLVDVGLVGTGWLGLVLRPCETALELVSGAGGGCVLGVRVAVVFLCTAMMGRRSTRWGDVNVGALADVGVIVVDLAVVVDLVGTG